MLLQLLPAIRKIEPLQSIKSSKGRSSPGADGVPTKFSQKGLNKPLGLVFNHVLATGLCPESLKVRYISLVSKKAYMCLFVGCKVAFIVFSHFCFVIFFSSRPFSHPNFYFSLVFSCFCLSLFSIILSSTSTP